jgi:hypothetical protein
MLPTTEKQPAVLRPQREIEERLWLLLGQLPDAAEDQEDQQCAYLTGLLFALGAEWTDARLAALTLWNERLPVPAEQQCGRCVGCGQIANDTDGTPWIYWMGLPIQNSQAVIVGLVKPLPCPKCGGTGGEPVLNGLTASLGPGPGRDG